MPDALIVLVAENVTLLGIAVRRRLVWSRRQNELQATLAAEAELETRELGEPLPPPPEPLLQGTYRKKPLMVQARRWDGSYLVAQEILEWIGEDRGIYQDAIIPEQTTDVAPLPAQPAHLFVYCAEGAVEVFVDWWVVKEPEHIGGRAHTVLDPESMYDQYDLIEED